MSLIPPIQGSGTPGAGNGVNNMEVLADATNPTDQFNWNVPLSKTIDLDLAEYIKIIVIFQGAFDDDDELLIQVNSNGGANNNNILVTSAAAYTKHIATGEDGITTGQEHLLDAPFYTIVEIMLGVATEVGFSAQDELPGFIKEMSLDAGTEPISYGAWIDATKYTSITNIRFEANNGNGQIKENSRVTVYGVKNST